MKNLTTLLRTRRNVLTGMAASGLTLAAGKSLADDRAMLEAAQGRGDVTLCDNGGVPVSAVETRRAVLDDFNGGQGCALTPDTVEGPYFICTDATIGKDITGGKPGQPLSLALRVLDQTCTPVSGAIVDVWHCDARGNYSGHVVDPDVFVRPAPGRRAPDAPTRFLRGVLATDADGIAEFDAIYPGYYYGRPIHTHYKVHVSNRAFMTSQALYPEDINEQVMAMAPYSDPRSSRRTLNNQDMSIIGPTGEFRIAERGGRLLATVTLVVAV